MTTTPAHVLDGAPTIRMTDKRAAALRVLASFPLGLTVYAIARGTGANVGPTKKIVDALVTAGWAEVGFHADAADVDVYRATSAGRAAAWA